ncbi:hypothetical protein D3C72_1439710 [compost metagenome]
MKPSRYSMFSAMASWMAAGREESGIGMTTSICTPGNSARIFSARYSPIFRRVAYTEAPSMTESGRAR